MAYLDPVDSPILTRAASDSTRVDPRVGQEVIRGGTVPVPLSRGRSDRVTGPDHGDLTTAGLDQPDSLQAASPSARAPRRPARQQMRPSVQRILDSMTTTPAYVRNGRLDILASWAATLEAAGSASPQPGQAH